MPYTPSFTPTVATPGGSLSPLDMQQQTLFSPAAGASMQLLPQFRGQQLGAINDQQSFLAALRARALGQGGPSPAELMLQRARDANNANAASAIGSARGINPALAQRQILDTQAANNQQEAGQAGVLRAQEQQQAVGQALQGEGLLDESLIGARGQDIGQALGYGGLQNQQTAIAANASQADTGNYTQLIGSALSGASAIGAAAAMPAPAGHARGGRIPGRALVPGDSPKNDRVPAMLSPGEVVLPRSVSQAEDAPEKAAAFVRAIQRRHYAQSGATGYARVLAARRAHA